MRTFIVTSLATLLAISPLAAFALEGQVTPGADAGHAPAAVDTAQVAQVIQQLLGQTTAPTVSDHLQQLLQQYPIQTYAPWQNLTQAQVVDAIGKLEVALQDPRIQQAVNGAVDIAPGANQNEHGAQIAGLLVQVAALQAQIDTLLHGQQPPAQGAGQDAGAGAGAGHEVDIAPAQQAQVPPNPIQLPASDEIQGLICPIIEHTLQRGAQGTEVITLQQYLIRIGLLAEGNVTGFFGPLTEAAVQLLQATKVIVTDGTPDTTGWGVIGPRTRAALQNCHQ